MRWSAAMHYVGAVDDFPQERCEFPGLQGWAGTRSINVLDGMKNVTKILADWGGVSEGDVQLRGSPSSSVPGALQEEAFKFLVHFVGDMHQPLHLTGRARGGNSIKVHFGRKLSSKYRLFLKLWSHTHSQ
jgi:S1/P1 Nuclease